MKHSTDESEGRKSEKRLSFGGRKAARKGVSFAKGATSFQCCNNAGGGKDHKRGVDTSGGGGKGGLPQ